MLFLWYCFDEWAARTADVEWLGTVPWPLILLLHLPLAFGVFSVKVRNERV